MSNQFFLRVGDVRREEGKRNDKLLVRNLRRSRWLSNSKPDSYVTALTSRTEKTLRLLLEP